MLKKQRLTLITSTVLVVLAFSAMWTGPAFADDSTPPPPVETPTEVAPPPVDEPAQESTAPLSEVLEQLPEGTEVVVTDSAGEAIPLASQEAADAINYNGDPMWCPAGVVPGAATCSPHFTTFNQDIVTPAQTGLIAWLIANPKNVAGVIWVANNYNGSLEIGNSIVLDGNIFDDGDLVFTDTMDNFALTIQGGWSGGANKTITTPSVITKRLSITGWNGNITLNDLVFTPTIADASTYTALNVDTSKNILLERVTVEGADNTGSGIFNGANLDNTTGLGTVTINVNNSNFQDNEGDGLLIYSAGVVTTNNLTANLNGGWGALIDNSSSLTDKAVTMKGQKQFNKNGLDGLYILSNGAVTLSNIVANLNSGNGVYVDNTTSLTNLGVTITGSNSFVGNSGGSGLVVFTHGVISAANITATDNGDNGVWLDNCDDDTGFQCQLSLAKTVTLSGMNTFNSNGLSGLIISSYGAISVSNVIAKGNGESGAYLDNNWFNTPTNPLATPLESKGTITLTGNNTFSTNGVYGLEAYSHGNIAIANLTANDNFADDGVHLSAGKAVGVANVTITGINSFNNNGDDGLFISADGKVTLNNASAYFNTGDGADLTASDLGMGATLSGTNSFMYNIERGLVIDASGAITASNLTASFNGGYGAWLDSLYLTDSTKMYNVTLTGNNSFNANGDIGLEVRSFGTIAINNLTANENGLSGIVVGQGYGAFLDNCILNVTICYATTPKTVTLTGVANLNGNRESGLYITSIGAVTATSVSAEGNGGAGADINNSYINTKPQTVTLKGSNSFSGNLADGLKIFSYGAIALNNVTANFNEDNGVYLDNYRSGSPLGVALTPKTITLTGVNSFLANYHDGLKFDSSGAVVLNRVNADGNTDSGNDAGYAGSGIKGTARTGSITLVCGNTFLNEGYGYNINALLGPIIIKGIYSYSNGLVDINTGTVVTKTQACALP